MSERGPALPAPWRDDVEGLPESGRVIVRYGNGRVDCATTPFVRDQFGRAIQCWAPLPGDPYESGWRPGGAPMIRPEFLYGVPDAEVLYATPEEVWEIDVVPFGCNDGDEWTVETFTVKDPLRVGANPDFIVEMVVERLSEDLEQTEHDTGLWDSVKNPECLELARQLSESIAGRVTHHMADNRVATHVWRQENDRPVLVERS